MHFLEFVVCLCCVCGPSLNSSRGELKRAKVFYIRMRILFYILYLIFYILSFVFQSEALALTAVRACSYASKTLVFFFLPFDVAKVRKILTHSKYFSNYFYIK